MWFWILDIINPYDIINPDGLRLWTIFNHMIIDRMIINH